MPRLANGFWAVTGYDAVHDVLRARACASGPIAGRYLAALPEGAARDEMSHRINFLDPPDHTRVRSLVSKAFTPRRVDGLLPWIAATAHALADGIDAARPFDLLTAFSHQLPSLVISELLGVPAADRDLLTGWADAVAPLLALEVDDATRSAALAASEQFHAYIGALLDERRRQPGDDLLSALLAAEEDGAKLSRVELLSLAATPYSAGHRTTRDLFTNGMGVLLTSPALYADVARGRYATTDVVEEFLRYVTPTLFVVRIIGRSCVLRPRFRERIEGRRAPMPPPRHVYRRREAHERQRRRAPPRSEHHARHRRRRHRCPGTRPPRTAATTTTCGRERPRGMEPAPRRMRWQALARARQRRAGTSRGAEFS